MKVLIVAIYIILSPLLSKSQNKRWMYLAATEDRAYLFVDTMSSDIIQDTENHYLKRNGMKLNEYGTNSVTFWTMFYEKTFKNKKPIVIRHLSKILIDTIENKYRSLSRIAYENDRVMDQDNTIIDWVDIVPDTIAELFVKFGKSINNRRLKQELLFNAYLKKDLYPNVNKSE